MGYNSRLDELQAAILRVKLPYLEEWNESRRTLAEGYQSELEERFSAPKVEAECVHNYHLFVIQCEERDRLQEHLRRAKLRPLSTTPCPATFNRPFRNQAQVLRFVDYRAARPAEFYRSRCFRLSAWKKWNTSRTA